MMVLLTWFSFHLWVHEINLKSFLHVSVITKRDITKSCCYFNSESTFILDLCFLTVVVSKKVRVGELLKGAKEVRFPFLVILFSLFFFFF